MTITEKELSEGQKASLSKYFEAFRKTHDRSLADWNRYIDLKLKSDNAVRDYKQARNEFLNSFVEHSIVLSQIPINHEAAESSDKKTMELFEIYEQTGAAKTQIEQDLIILIGIPLGQDDEEKNVSNHLLEKVNEAADKLNRARKKLLPSSKKLREAAQNPQE